MRRKYFEVKLNPGDHITALFHDTIEKEMEKYINVRARNKLLPYPDWMPAAPLSFPILERLKREIHGQIEIEIKKGDTFE